MSVWLSGFPDGVFRELCECARICSESMHAQFCAHNQWWCSPRTDEHFFRPNQIHRYWIMIMLFVCAANANAVHCGAIRASWIKCYIVMYICMLLSSNCFRFHTYTHSTNRCKTQRSILEQFACLAWWSCCAQMKISLTESYRAWFSAVTITIVSSFHFCAAFWRRIPLIYSILCEWLAGQLAMYDEYCSWRVSSDVVPHKICNGGAGVSPSTIIIEFLPQLKTVYPAVS